MDNSIVIPTILGTPNVPDTVYHYTSMETALRIIKSKELWATNVRYLNDVSEHSLFVKATADRVGRFAETHANVKPERFYEHELFVHDVKEPFYHLPFVTSFAELDDSLTHWRSYCTRGNGVSIGFRTEALSKARVREPKVLKAGMIVPQPRFSKVLYVEPSNPVEIDKALSEAYVATQLSCNEWEMSAVAPGPFGDMFFFEVQQIAAFHKHRSFLDEREYRLLLNGVQWRRDLIEYRASASTLIPYVPLQIPRISTKEDDSGRLWTAIESITIGPTPNKELSCYALEAHCETEGLQVEVRTTNVPYRDW